MQQSPHSSKQLGCLFSTIVAAAGIIFSGLLIHRWKKIPAAKNRIEILHVPIDPVTMPEALERIEHFIQTGEPHHVFTADASGIMRAQDEVEFQKIIKQADLITPDGAGVLFASRMYGVALPERVSGVDLVENISELAAKTGYSIYLFGAAEGVAKSAADQLLLRYPELKIVGVRNGYYTPEQEEEIVVQIVQTKPDVLFVALGIPKQELFIHKYFNKLHVPVMIGIGGSFDVISGRLNRAPVWMQRTGLEWMYRLLQEPSRLPRLSALFQFVLAVRRERK